MSFFEKFNLVKKPQQKADSTVAAGGSVVKGSVDLPTGHRVEVVLADLTREKVDAIVNAANAFLAHGGGLARAIVKAGGDVIQRESDRYMAKHHPGRKESMAVAEVAITSAGKLPCKHVLHTVGPIWRDGRAGEPDDLALSLVNTLKAAESVKATSVSCPAISSGIFGFPRDLCAKVLFVTAVKYYTEINPQSCVKVLRFTNFDSETTSHFEHELQLFLASEGMKDLKVSSTPSADDADVPTASESAPPSGPAGSDQASTT